MKPASLAHLRKALESLSGPELLELCVRLARYRKENKEMLSFLLFDAHDLQGFLSDVRREITALFSEINTSHIYFAKKSIRKILRLINRYIRFAASLQAEADLLIHFCNCMRNSGIDYSGSVALANLYTAQIRKIKKAVSAMHEDLQFDYRNEIAMLLA